jgi:S-adenosyl-L-methionine hydrolase (adenosine-forming)
MPAPILTLTTDFGLSDHYVGVMKGVILSICPTARIVDISHQASPFDVIEGAYLIAQAYRYFPKKTVHIVVVDPGVGTARRPILMEAAGQYFIAPDNGALAMIFSREKHKIRLISNDRYFRKPVSPTFHGRDIFAPVAAHLAAGTPPTRMGKPIDDYLRPAFEKPRQSGKRTWVGTILKIDHFGNIVTNFHTADFPDLERRDFSLSIGGIETSALVRTYAEAGPGELCVIVGSSGYLEVSMNQASAAAKIGCQSGASAELTVPPAILLPASVAFTTSPSP